MDPAFKPPASGTERHDREEIPAARNREAVEARAREIWEEEGRPEGRHEDHWRRAEEELGGCGG